jgi:hypothetical protein
MAEPDWVSEEEFERRRALFGNATPAEIPRDEPMEDAAASAPLPADVPEGASRLGELVVCTAWLKHTTIFARAFAQSHGCAAVLGRWCRAR